MRRRNAELKPIDKPVYSYFQALYMSFYSSQLYVDVIKRWRGYGAIYCWLLALILSIPMGLKYAPVLLLRFDEEVFYPVSLIPDVYIQNGQVTIDKPLPYLARDPKQHVVVAVENDADENEMMEKYPHLRILITKNSIYFRTINPRTLLLQQEKGETKDEILSYAFEANQNSLLSGELLTQWLHVNILKKILLVIFFPLMWGALFAMIFFIIFVLSSIGRLISIVVLKYPIPFQESYRLTAVSSTLPWLLVIGLVLFPNAMKGANGSFIFIAGVATYFSYGVLCVKRVSKRMVHA